MEHKKRELEEVLEEVLILNENISINMQEFLKIEIQRLIFKLEEELFATETQIEEEENRQPAKDFLEEYKKKSSRGQRMAKYEIVIK